MDAWRRFNLVQVHLASHLARQLTRATGLSEADYQVLDALVDAPGCRARALELRWTLQWEKSRLSHQVARMVSRGLLERHACVEDARGFDVVLTAAGRDAARRARRVREELVRTFVIDTLGADRLANLTEVADLLAERLAQAAQEDPICREAYAEAMAQGGDETCCRAMCRRAGSLHARSLRSRSRSDG